MSYNILKFVATAVAR